MALAAETTAETPLRECRRCREMVPETEYYRARTGHPDSQGLKRQSKCKRCANHQRDEYNAGIRYAVPTEPFAQWLDRKYDRYRREWFTEEVHNHISPSRGRIAFAEMLGTNEKLLRRIMRREQRLVHIDTVDHILTREGSTCLFELYPELYPDTEVAA